MDLNGKTLLVTGATGSFGTAFIRRVLARLRRQGRFGRSAATSSSRARSARHRRQPLVRYLLGDVRDRDRLRLATRGVDVVVHAAALKQVPACEYNPFEAVKTNILGAQNIIDAAIDTAASHASRARTDKAVNPINLYGATKLCAEKLFVQANAYAGGTPTRFACVRYGNVVGSRGSVIPFFRQQAADRADDDHRRADDALLDHARAGRRVRAQLPRPHARAARCSCPRSRRCASSTWPRRSPPAAEREIIGIRPGEKLHEVLVTEDEARNTLRLRRPLRHPARPAGHGAACRRRRCPTASATARTPTTGG